MTAWHYILIGSSALALLAIATVITWLVRATADKGPDTTTVAPESEADRRVTTTLTRGRNTYII